MNGKNAQHVRGTTKFATYAFAPTNSMKQLKISQPVLPYASKMLTPMEKTRTHDVSETADLDRSANLARNYAMKPCLGLPVPLLC